MTTPGGRRRHARLWHALAWAVTSGTATVSCVDFDGLTRGKSTDAAPAADDAGSAGTSGTGGQPGTDAADVDGTTTTDAASTRPPTGRTSCGDLACSLNGSSPITQRCTSAPPTWTYVCIGTSCTCTRPDGTVARAGTGSANVFDSRLVDEFCGHCAD
ncbi:MAG: hypothetical protein U0169_27115 [Polyangiaceae bacterium]